MAGREPKNALAENQAKRARRQKKAKPCTVVLWETQVVRENSVGANLVAHRCT
jgi:hypothetical protein